MGNEIRCEGRVREGEDCSGAQVSVNSSTSLENGKLLKLLEKLCHNMVC